MEVYKLRGKRKRGPAQKSDVARRRGRPMRNTSEVLATNKAEQEHQVGTAEEPQSSGSDDTIQPHGPLSPLERLPSELIHQIFFQCLEVNMAKASVVIGRMLSNDVVYNLLIQSAFLDDDGILRMETSPHLYPESSINEKIRIQETILNCRWCSLKRFEACMSDNNSIPEDYHNACPPHAEAKHAGIVSQTYYNASERTRDASPSKDGSIINQVQHIRTSHCRKFPCRLVPRHIPNKLLTGKPWTPEKLAFLKQLRQGFRHHTCVYVLHVSPQALFQGMEDAINEKNPTALLVLLEVHDAAFHINRVKQSAQIKRFFQRGRLRTSHSPHKKCYTTPNSHPLPISLFHLTTKHTYKDAEPLLSLLIRGGLDSISNDDPTMTKWALSTAADDASPYSLSAFLLSYMEGGFVDLKSDKMFGRGRLLAELPQRYHCIDKASFAKEIGYEMPPA